MWVRLGRAIACIVLCAHIQLSLDSVVSLLHPVHGADGCTCWYPDYGTTDCVTNTGGGFSVVKSVMQQLLVSLVDSFYLVTYLGQERHTVTNIVRCGMGISNKYMVVDIF